MSDRNFTYLFYISLKSGVEYHLTSSSDSVMLVDKLYVPFSGLSFESSEFNDSAQNNIVLHGIFENLGITCDQDLVGANIKIINFNRGEAKELVTYICTKQIFADLEFRLVCEPDSIKFNQSLLPSFTKTCRANFCDKNCKLNIDDFKVAIEVVSKNSKSLICRGIDKYSNGYFSGGKLFIEYVNSKKEECMVNSHFANKIELRDEVHFKLEDIEEIKLSPTCNKKIRTCCYSFNNTVNFRGEPDIPEYRIIKN